MYRASNIAIAFCLVACGNNFGDVSNPPPNDLGAPDSGVEAGVHTSNMCCQLTMNDEDSGPWFNARYDCEPDAARPFDLPWICNVNSQGLCGGDTGVECLSVALDEYAGEYQCTVYPNGKAGPNIMDHHHYEAKTLEEAILLAANNHLPR